MMLEFKQVIVIRRDLKMGTGKTAAQAAHASLLGVERVKSEKRRWFDACEHEYRSEYSDATRIWSDLGEDDQVLRVFGKKKK